MGRPQTKKPSLLDSFRRCWCCGGGAQEGGADHVLQPLNLFNPRAQTSQMQLVQQSESARLRLFQKLGSLQEFVLTQSATPTAAAAASKWPTASQRFRVVHRANGSVLIVSDGLSDPFDDLQSEANVNGYGLEFFIETPAEEIGSTPAEIKASWQFQLLYTVCSLAAGHGSIRSIIDDMALLSTEAEGVGDAVPQEHRKALVNRAGRVGALLGLTETELGSPAYIPETIDGMPLTDVKLVNIKLISLAELKLITQLGAEGRKKLSELFAGPNRLASSLNRDSAI